MMSNLEDIADDDKESSDAAPVSPFADLETVEEQEKTKKLDQ
jgi:hypothetical protein